MQPVFSPIALSWHFEKVRTTKDGGYNESSFAAPHWKGRKKQLAQIAAAHVWADADLTGWPCGYGIWGMTARTASANGSAAVTRAGHPELPCYGKTDDFLTQKQKSGKKRWRRRTLCRYSRAST